MSKRTPKNLFWMDEMPRMQDYDTIKEACQTTASEGWSAEQPKDEPKDEPEAGVLGAKAGAALLSALEAICDKIPEHQREEICFAAAEEEGHDRYAAEECLEGGKMLGCFECPYE